MIFYYVKYMIGEVQTATFTVCISHRTWCNVHKIHDIVYKNLTIWWINSQIIKNINSPAIMVTTTIIASLVWYSMHEFLHMKWHIFYVIYTYTYMYMYLFKYSTHTMCVYTRLTDLQMATKSSPVGGPSLDFSDILKLMKSTTSWLDFEFLQVH